MPKQQFFGNISLFRYKSIMFSLIVQPKLLSGQILKSVSPEFDVCPLSEEHIECSLLQHGSKYLIIFRHGE